MNNSVQETAAVIAYKSALKRALWIQFILGILFALLLDGGVAFAVYKVAWIGQFIATILIIARGWESPTKFDLAFIRYGIFFSMFAAIILKTFLGPDL